MPSHSMLRAYKEKCCQLNQAVNQIKPIEIVTKDDKTLRFNNVGVQSGKFFGIENIKGKIQKILLNLNDIKMITLL